MRTRTSLVALAIAATVGAFVAPGVAQADTSTYQPEPWHPVVQQEWTAAAGRFCTFPLGLDVLYQDIRARVVERYADGAVKVEEFTGPLKVDFVNADTGARVTYDAGGRAVAEYRQDGTYEKYTMFGPVGLGMPEGATGLPKGYYMVDGFHVVEFAQDGSRAMTVANGVENNVCDDLD